MRNKFFTTFLLTVLIVLLVGCGRAATIPTDIPSADDTHKEPEDEDTEAPYEEVEEDSSYMNDVQYYIDKIVSEEEVSEDDIVMVHVDEYEGEGLYSAFIFTGGIQDEEMGIYEGELWFVSENCIESLMVCECYSIDNILEFTNTDRKFFYVDEYYVTQAVSHVFGVENGEVYETPISCIGSVSDVKNNDFTIVVSAYDSSYFSADGFTMGHTWKPYYFTYDSDRDGFKEYIAKTVDADSLVKLCGENIISEIGNLGGNVTDIFVRDNGITTVNYYTVSNYDDDEHEITYRNANYNIKERKYIDAWGTGDNSLEGSDFGGTYSAVLVPSLLYDSNMDVDDIYSLFVEGNIVDSDGNYCWYSEESMGDEIELLEWAKYDIDNNGTCELIPRLFGSYTTCIYTIENGVINTIYLDGIFGSEGGFFNTKNQYVGTDCSHANRNQYIISEYNGTDGFENVLYFGVWWEDESNPSANRKYQKYEGDFWTENVTEDDFVTISEAEFEKLSKEYLAVNTEIKYSK